ncbi:RecX family transcriptional regulator [Curtobacterium sp. BRD11]|uniref:RecX family transcriptional regulator n=1 Tax=Curtobacterium sp. BRD11 TaxID=2962581 RepID=UPI0028823E6C|nr:RecX family transcriptional regulator [Curtobacterium sp. BRD11]MDT0210561.1 RecX family transcriptional regulator [Curtobacterium sp. BRD11]
MTGADDHDEGLAPVSDLFGARSRRGRRTPPAEPEPVRSSPVEPGTAEPGTVRPGTVGPGTVEPNPVEPSLSPVDLAPRAERGVPGGTGSSDDGWAPESTVLGDDERRFGRASTTAAHDESASSGSATGTPVEDDPPVPAAIPFRGQQSEAEWVSPVVGDGSGRSARAEQHGYDDDDTADAASASVFAIASGDEIDPADAPRPLDEQRADAERVSMRALGRKGVSESEMRQLLTKQDLDDDVVEHEVARLVRVGLLDDVALATDLVDRLHERKGLGRQGVVAELRRRGIDQAAIDAALEAAEDDADDEFVRAIELAEKRARQLRGLDRATAERRLSGFLMRKGYGSGVVRIAVERALDGPPRRSPSGGGTVRFE